MSFNSRCVSSYSLDHPVGCDLFIWAWGVKAEERLEEAIHGVLLTRKSVCYFSVWLYRFLNYFLFISIQLWTVCGKGFSKDSSDLLTIFLTFNLHGPCSCLGHDFQSITSKVNEGIELYCLLITSKYSVPIWNLFAFFLSGYKKRNLIKNWSYLNFSLYAPSPTHTRWNCSHSGRIEHWNGNIVSQKKWTDIQIILL